MPRKTKYAFAVNMSNDDFDLSILLLMNHYRAGKLYRLKRFVEESLLKLAEIIPSTRSELLGIHIPLPIEWCVLRTQKMVIDTPITTSWGVYRLTDLAQKLGRIETKYDVSLYATLSGISLEVFGDGSHYTEILPWDSLVKFNQEHGEEDS